MGHSSKFQEVSRLGSVTARHSSSGRQPNFTALNRGRHLYSAGRPSRWTLAHILVLMLYCYYGQNARSSCAGIYITQRVILMFFDPQDQRVAPMWTIFGVEVSSPHWWTGGGVDSHPSTNGDSQKWKFRDYGNSGYKRPVAEYPLGDFSRNFQSLWTVPRRVSHLNLWTKYLTVKM